MNRDENRGDIYKREDMEWEGVKGGGMSKKEVEGEGKKVVGMVLEKGLLWERN